MTEDETRPNHHTVEHDPTYQCEWYTQKSFLLSEEEIPTLEDMPDILKTAGIYTAGKVAIFGLVWLLLYPFIELSLPALLSLGAWLSVVFWLAIFAYIGASKLYFYRQKKQEE